MPPAGRAKMECQHSGIGVVESSACTGSGHMRLGGETQGGGKILERGFPVEGHVGSDMVVEVFVAGEGWGGVGDGEFAVVGALELGSRGVVGALDAAVGFGRPLREDEQWEIQVAAGLLELGHELGAAVDLEGHDPGVVGEQRFEEAAGAAGGGACEDAAEHEPGGRADGAELLQGPAVAGDGHVVDLDELAGRGGAQAGREAPGVAAGEVAPPLRPRPSAEEGAGAHVSERDAFLKDPSDGGLGQEDAVAGEHDAEPGPAHEGVFPALAPNRPLVAACPFAPAGGAWPAAPRGQPVEAAVPLAPLPAVQGRPPVNVD